MPVESLGTTGTEPAGELIAEWQRWHAEREHALATEHGWLSLTGFGWLPDQPASVDGIPGRWSAAGGEAALRAAESDQLAVISIDGGADQPVVGTVVATAAEAGSRNWIRTGDRIVELILRGGRYAVRVRDPQAPTRLRFAGVPTFEVDPRWVRAGAFTRFDEPGPVTVDTARADLRQQITAVGTVTIDLPGAELPLLVAAGADGTLNLLFHDDTNGVTTAPWRSVVTSAPADDGPLTVDFNHAVNMPFAFSDYGTCPAPPAGNRLPVAVTAGEKAPADRRGSTSPTRS